MAIALALILAYLIGSLPTAYIVGRLRRGIDIREVGSRNMGAMNVIYQVGPADGVFVIFVDIVKGMMAVYIATLLDSSMIVPLVAGAMAVIGHSFPVFLGFRGGKGGATCIGVLAWIMPWGVPVYIAMLLTSMAATRFLTLSYSLALVCFPFVAWLIYGSGTLIIFSVGLLMLPAVKYLSRVKEMYSKAGSWRKVLFRSSFKERI